MLGVAGRNTASWSCHGRAQCVGRPDQRHGSQAHVCLGVWGPAAAARSLMWEPSLCQPEASTTGQPPGQCPARCRTLSGQRSEDPLHQRPSPLWREPVRGCWTSALPGVHATQAPRVVREAATEDAGAEGLTSDSLQVRPPGHTGEHPVPEEWESRMSSVSP